MAILQQRVGFTRDRWMSISDNTSAGALDDVSTNNLSTIRFTAATSISGFANGYDGKELEIINSTGGVLTIQHEGSGSSAGNRIVSPTGINFTINNNTVLRFRYLSAINRWILTTTPTVTGAAFTTATINNNQTSFAPITGLSFPVDGTVNGFKVDYVVIRTTTSEQRRETGTIYGHYNGLSSHRIDVISTSEVSGIHFDPIVSPNITYRTDNMAGTVLIHEFRYKISFQA